MKSLFIMGTPRGGTTVTQDLFREVPGVTIMDEQNIIDVTKMITLGLTVVWKSPHNCLDGVTYQSKFPEVVHVYVVRDGRANLAAYKQYLEVTGTDPSFPPYQGSKGFISLWNQFASLALKFYWFRLEDLLTERGVEIIHQIFDMCGYSLADSAVDFWRKNICNPSGVYPRKAISYRTPPWRDLLTLRELGWFDLRLLKELGYE